MNTEKLEKETLSHNLWHWNSSFVDDVLHLRSLLTHLSSRVASKLDSKVRTDDDCTGVDTASKVDSYGNPALHVFVFNESL